MSLKQLIDFIGEANIAGSVDPATLALIGERVKRQFQEDWGSMKEWREDLRDGIKLMKQEFKTKSTPWEGASNFKSPLLTKAAISFGDKASLEILRTPKLVKTDIIGKDPDNSKKKRAERVSESMNYQLNHEMVDWKKDQKRLLYTLPNHGCMFKKTVFNPLERTNESHVIQYPDFAVNQATTSMAKCRSFTQILDFDQNEVFERQRSGLWLNIDIYPEKAEGDEGSNEAEGVTKAEENPNRFLEQQCFADLDGDGYEEPYIITIHLETGKIVRIVARFDEASFIIKTKEGRILSLKKAIMDETRDTELRRLIAASRARQPARVQPKDARVQPINPEVQPLDAPAAQGVTTLQQAAPPTTGQAVPGQQPAGPVPAPIAQEQQPVEPIPEGFDLSKFELIRIDPLQPITKYGFLPSPDGTFLDVGYSHLLGAITQAVNSSTNQLTDAGTLRNLGGGFLAKNARKKMGPLRMKIGEWISTELPAQLLQQGFMPNPSPEPSTVLMALNDAMKQEGQQLAALVDNGGAIAPNTAPTTALAIIQENLIPTSALIARVLDAESEEFQVLFRLNQRFFDPEVYKMVLGEPDANAFDDFNSEALNVVPTASAEMSSKMQRIQLATVELEQFPLVVQAGGNGIALLKRYYEAIGSQDIEQIFPEEGTMSPEEKQQVKLLQQTQQQANEQKGLEIQLLTEQIKLLSREQDRLDGKTRAEIAKLIKEVEKTVAETAKLAEEAETESLNNSITTYSATLQTLKDSLNTIGTPDDSTPSRQPLRAVAAGNAGPVP